MAELVYDRGENQGYVAMEGDIEELGKYYMHLIDLPAQPRYAYVIRTVVCICLALLFISSADLSLILTT